MDAPIGVFDSGVGGLTVLRALTARLPAEHTVYLGDTARVPYGTRSRDVVTRYALLCARHLAGQGIKMLVVACNTVSAGAYQAALRRLAPLSTVVARACPLFVPLAEEGWTEGEVPRLVAERYL